MTLQDAANKLQKHGYTCRFSNGCDKNGMRYLYVKKNRADLGSIRYDGNGYITETSIRTIRYFADRYVIKTILGV